MITPIFVHFSKTENSKLLVTELLESNQGEYVSSQVLNNEFDKNSILIKKETFRGFENLRIIEQISRLETQYKSYKTKMLKEIFYQINTVQLGESFLETNNTIYIPRFGKTNVISNLSQATLKPHNYYQVVLSEEIFSEYLIVFFKSLLGSLLLRSIRSDSLNQYLTRNDLLELRILIPSLEEQKEIISAQKDLAELKNQIIEFEALLEKNHVLEVECKPSKSPCFLDGTTFYVRTNPATDKLEGIKLADYLRNHFG